MVIRPHVPPSFVGNPKHRRATYFKAAKVGGRRAACTGEPPAGGDLRLDLVTSVSGSAGLVPNPAVAGMLSAAVAKRVIRDRAQPHLQGPTYTGLLKTLFRHRFGAGLNGPGSGTAVAAHARRRPLRHSLRPGGIPNPSWRGSGHPPQPADCFLLDSEWGRLRERAGPVLGRTRSAPRPCPVGGDTVGPFKQCARDPARLRRCLRRVPPGVTALARNSSDAPASRGSLPSSFT